MKTTSIPRVIAWAVHALVVTLLVAALGPWGLAAAFLNPHGMSSILGVSYPELNTTTVADLTGMTAKAREEIWVRRILFGADRMYQQNPFADGMMGGPLSQKAITTITETEKVAGNTVNIPTIAGFGGPGVAGEGVRDGNEEKLFIGNFQVQIGRFWFGVAFTSVAVEETVVGGPLDAAITKGLKQRMAKKKSDDIMRTMLAAGVPGTRNYLLPDGVANRDALKTANVMSTTLLSSGGIVLSSLGGMPMDVVTDPSGSTASKFVYLGTNHQLRPLDTEDAYLTSRINAGVRGPANAVWTGKYDDWLGHGIYRWEQIDHGNRGPIGSPLLPRAYLGTALTSATTNSVVTGGGSNAAVAVTPKPAWFEDFSNAPWTYFNNIAIAADTTTVRHLIIINPTGSYGVFPYQVNDGNQITISGAALSIGVGTETTTFVVGALVHECNILGVPVAKGLYLGAQAVVAGSGTINGNKADPQYGRRVVQVRNYEMDHGIGVEGVWGCAVVQRPDGVYPNFLVVETAVPVQGAPIIV